jgi:molecular chaperone GrpE
MSNEKKAHTVAPENTAQSDKEEPKEIKIPDPAKEGKESDRSAEIAELTSTLKRIQADFENYIKSVDREVKDREARGVMAFVEKILPVLDSFEMAISHEQNTDVKKALEIIYAQLWTILSKEGLRPIETTNTAFNPYFHEVLLTVPGVEENKIVECLQRGYMLKDKVLRHAKVKIAKK